MERQEISNLLNKSSDSKFVTRNKNIVNDQINTNYNAENVIIYNTEVLKSNLCNYKDAYILVRGDITIVGNITDRVAFKSSAPFTKCITKFDGTTIDNAEELDLVMPM